jgi:Fe-S-cluster-containing dehydrogenase component
MKRYYFVIDVERCIGCFNCLHACKDEHVGNSWLPVTLPQKRHEQYWITTAERVRGQHPMVDVAYLTEPCNHCEHAPCVEQSGGAIFRRPDGIVLIDPYKACREENLDALCPYGKISWNEESGSYQSAPSARTFWTRAGSSRAARRPVPWGPCGWFRWNRRRWRPMLPRKAWNLPTPS